MKNLKSFDLFEAEDNAPVLYHGTTNEFDKFEVGKPISNAPYGAAIDNGLGIFFTDNLTMAKWFGKMIEYDGDKDKYVPVKGSKGRVIKAKVYLKNPFVVESPDPDNEQDGVQEYFKAIQKAGGVEKFKKQLLDKGYDGVVIEDSNTNYYKDGYYKVWIVFSPNQIKIA